jgi:hypothetical protein
MDTQEKDEALNKIDQIIDSIDDLIRKYRFSTQIDNILKQALDLLNRAQRKF